MATRPCGSAKARRRASPSSPDLLPDLLPPPPPARPPRVLTVIILSHRAITTDCERFLERPVITLRVLLFVLSLAGLAGALCENWAKIRSYLQDGKAEAMGTAKKARRLLAIWPALLLLVVVADLFGTALARSSAHMVGKKQWEFDYFVLSLQ
ncbi:hypothetical protein E2562_025452 [Oryza meyeriana var. granulata]|uniref:Uncharacterized protein n=1 Tax=Oryza meyeriana var. granulata TaxID=110450 RepID=A0A6G1D7W0_9ORYZ|nr:hypothetical protein E2562_025452 [Oryza meyeriana var. granulata]